MIVWTFRAGGWASSESPVRIGESHSSSSMLLGRPRRNGSRKKSGGFFATRRWWAARRASGRKTSRVPIARNEPRSNLAAPMGCRDVDHATDSRVRAEDQAGAHELDVSHFARHLADGTVADRPPEPSAGIDGDHLAEQAAHAVADEHHPVERGVGLVGVEPPTGHVEIPPQEIGRVGDRVAGRVAERPELEAAVDLGIGCEDLNHPAATTPALAHSPCTKTTGIFPRT